MKLAENHDGETYRCAYVTEFEGVVYVLHVFQKKSKSGTKTPKEDKARVRVRFSAAKSHYEQNKSRYVAQVVSGRSTKRSPPNQGE